MLNKEHVGLNSGDDPTYNDKGVRRSKDTELPDFG